MEIWTEKYRPRKLEDMILPTEVFEQVKTWLKNPTILPNILLSSQQPGTGKTSLSRLVVRLLNADHIELNASDERGIQTVRDTITSFVTSRRINPSVPKIVLLDEADYLTDEAQATLRHLMEDVLNNARFILTCNSQNKIVDPIISRCYVIQLGTPPKDRILERLRSILESETVDCPEDLLNEVVNNYYPSIRDMLNWLQQWCISGGKISLVSRNDVPEKIWSLIKEGKVKEAREVWLQSAYNLTDLVSAFARYIDTLPPEKRRNASLILAKYDYRMAVGADPEVQVTALAWELSDVF